MSDRSATVRAQAIEGFAEVLCDLRRSAGTPSFRVMSGRSRAISHTTLHEAAQGNRLPSWGTTVEFVKACGADPADYRQRWQRANETVCSAGCPPASLDRGGAGASSGSHRAAAAASRRVVLDAQVDRPAPAQGVSATPTVPLESLGAVSAPRGRTRSPGLRRRTGTRWYAGLGLAAAGAIVAGVGLAWSASGDGGATAAPPPGHVAGDCPVHQQNPPSAPPGHKGDAAAFVADLTLPDCAHVGRGTQVQKVWRLKNVGTVPWVGYTLHRIDLPQGRDQCQTIPDVPIPDTSPGAMVDVEVVVAVPSDPGFCFVRFKMVDAAGAVAFPGSRPVNFQVVVD